MKDRPGVIIFRTTAGRQTGYGHLRRCLSLAEAFRQLKTDSVFLLDGEQVAVESARSSGFEALLIAPQEESAYTAKLLRKKQPIVIVIDSYGVDPAYLAELCTTNVHVAVIDDLADRELAVDLVINGSAGAEQLSYQGAPRTRYLLGCRYALLRAEFAEEPKRTIAREVQRVLITAGGADPTNLTPKLVRWVAQTLPGVSLDVVVGPLFDKNALDSSDPSLASQAKVGIHCNPKDMRALMLGADLAVTGGGQTAYELAATGTPAIAIRMAANQTHNLKGLGSAPALAWAGDADDADLRAKVVRSLMTLASDAGRRAEMSQRGRALVDGQGARRVAEAVLKA
jgi:UDP-2,4-diacetamido-2,4,6-trideoxy-beta-L-altropyranose hydrolase